MKKTILKSLLMGVAALTALTASAENKLIIEDFSIAAGETKEIAVYIQNDQVFNSFQFEFAPVEGLVFEYACQPDQADAPIALDDHWPYTKANVACAVAPQDNVLADGTYRVVLTHMTTYGRTGADKYVVPFKVGQGILCVIGVTAEENIENAEIICTHAKGDYSDPAIPEDVGSVGEFEINNQHVCYINPAVSGTPLATIVAEGVDGETYTVADDLHVVAKAGGAYFVSDGADNWMKVVAGDLLDGIDDIKGGTLVGELSEAAGNQTLTVTEAPEEATKVVTAEPVAWNLAQDDESAEQYIFNPKVNSVIKLTGYWWSSDQMFHGYMTGGQKVYVDFSWCANEVEMEDGLYKDVESVVQLRGTRALADDNAENFTVYPTSIDDTNVVTAIENVKGSKDVVSVQYVNVAGQVANTPFQGVNMVVTRYADGSTVTTKVIK